MSKYSDFLPTQAGPSAPSPITAFNATLSYAQDDLVVEGGKIYRANAAVTPKAFDPAEWTEIGADATDTVSGYSQAVNYPKDAVIVEGGRLYRSVNPVTAGGAFNAADWEVMDALDTKIHWKEVAVDMTAAANDGIFVDTTAAPVSITLPATPKLGDRVVIHDVAGMFDTNNCTVLRNGQNIMSLAQDMTVAMKYANCALVFSNSVHGWRLTNE